MSIDPSFSSGRLSTREALIGGESARQAYSGKSEHSGIENTQIFITQVIVSVLIFIVIISIFELIRSFIFSDFANDALQDKDSKNPDEEVYRTIAENKARILTNLVFSAVSIVILVVVVIVIYA